MCNTDGSAPTPIDQASAPPRLLSSPAEEKVPAALLELAIECRQILKDDLAPVGVLLDDITAALAAGASAEAVLATMLGARLTQP